MSRQIIITVPDDMEIDDVADYVRLVATQIEETYLSGHVGTDHHWTSEERLS